MADLVERARWIAETVLFPDADRVDRTGVVPESHWRVLAAEGFYGVAARQDVDLGAMGEALEVLAGGCLATTFTWVQHHGVVMGLSRSDNTGLRERFLDAAVAGRVRGGVAFAGALADPPRLRAEPVDGGWAFTGDGPFVSGWGTVDVLQVSGVHGDSVVNALVDAKAAPGLTARPFDLVAAQATNTARLVFDGLRVPADRVLSTVGLQDFRATQAFGSRLNGCLALGIARRCATLLDDLDQPTAAAAIRDRVDTVRTDLDAGLGDVDALLAARAAGSALAYRAAGAVVVAEGGRGVTAGGHGQRLVREAGFTLVAASRAAVKAALLADLTGAPDRGHGGQDRAAMTSVEVTGSENIG
ncbi:acyl-CoA dehydrogenase family protein [Actinokineospora spheciospongiae]|uniref:acyl-CoA dehydrogenase family protein n=1 Tax=Actinokineospora spheciospongiae TaxID=909613 RepID=UPI0007C6C543|nr:acyl-CoA dehydrogenase family protein [Actinokineospora spheciospongiae]PWW59529.1 alkylation response protein AidB-like acyl-CoA dehydrogenase [Actinokineospora spheciospongiae]